MACLLFRLLLLILVSASGYCRNPVTERASQVNCIDAASSCRGNRHCRTALRTLDEKCKIFNGRCSAEMVDLPRCGQIMDLIFSLGFPEEPCNCSRNFQKCSTLLNKVYRNPCFVSIRHLRKHNVFPEEINATGRTADGGDRFTTPTPESWASEHFDPKHDTDDKVFDDNSIAATVSAPFVNNKDQEEDKFKLVVDENGTKTDEIAVANKPEQIDARNGPVRRGGEDGDTLEVEDRTDYKLITIILGTILGIFLLSAVVFFAWTRVGKSLYTKGKVMSKRTKEDGTSSPCSENGTAPRSKE